MSNSANDILSSLKGSINDNVPARRDGSIAVQSHEKNPQTVTFQVVEGEITFPYAYIRHLRFSKGKIIVRTSDAKVTVIGRNLNPLFQKLRRYALSVVLLSAKDDLDDDQSIVERITVLFDEDED